MPRQLGRQLSSTFALKGVQGQYPDTVLLVCVSESLWVPRQLGRQLSSTFALEEGQGQYPDAIIFVCF